MMTMMNDAERHEASNMEQYQAEDCDQETCEPTRCACKQSNAKQDQGAVQSTAARDVLAERRRQIEAEGWTPEHDDAYAEGDLAQAASCYSLYAHCSENLDRAALAAWQRTQAAEVPEGQQTAMQQRDHYAARVETLELGLLRIADDYHPSTDAEAPLALAEMRDAIHGLVLAAAPAPGKRKADI